MIIALDHYPAPSIIDIYPDWVENSMGNKLVEEWRSVLVSFHTKKPHSDTELLLVGSGFLVDLGGCVVITTAAHVIDEIKEQEICFLGIEGRYYLFRDCEIYHQETQDYAVITLSPEMLSKPITYMELANRAFYIPTSSFMIFGYPCNKNKMNVKESWAMNTYNIMFHHFSYDTDTEDIIFPFDTRSKKGTKLTYEPESGFKSLPSLKGMSGCPIAQLMIDKKTKGIVLKPIGIFKEHHQRKKKCLIGCTFVPFADEINTLLSIS